MAKRQLVVGKVDGGQSRLQAGRELLARQKYRAACIAFAEAAAGGSTGAEVNGGWAEALVGLSNYDEAVSRCEVALAADPSQPETYKLLQNILTRLSTPDAAVTRIQQTIDDARITLAHLHWADALLELGKYDLAVREYQKAAPGLKLDGSAHMRWGRALLRAGRDLEAVKHYHTALRNGCVSEDLFKLLTEAIAAHGAPDRLIRRLQRVVDRLDTKEARLCWAGALGRLQRFDQSEAEYRKALAKNPNDVVTNIDCGRARDSAGDIAGAVACFEVALSAPTLTREEFWNLHDALAASRGRDALISQLDKRLHSIHAPRVLNRWGDILYFLERYRDAIAAYEETDEASIDDPQTFANWGQALAAQGRFTEAGRKYCRAIEINPALAHSLDAVPVVRTDPRAAKSLIAQLRRTVDRIDSPFAHTVMAELFAEIREYASAWLQYGEALKNLDLPRSPGRAAETRNERASVYVSWARVFAGAGRHVDAVKKYLAAIQESGVFWQPDLLRESLRHVKRLEPTIEDTKGGTTRIQNGGQFSFTRNRLSVFENDRQPTAVSQESLIEEIETTIKAMDDGDTYRRWGDLLHDLGHHSRAATQYALAAGKLADDPWTYIGWGDALGALGRHGEAVRRYEDAVRLSSGEPQSLEQALRGFLRTAAHLDNELKSVERLQEIVDWIDGNDAYGRWADVLGKLGYSAARLELFHRMIKKSPTDARLRAHFGYALVFADRHEEGLEQHQYAADQLPTDVWVQSSWGISLGRLRRYEDAIEKLRVATELGESDAFFDWALALANLGRYDGAKQKYEECIANSRNPVLVAYARHNIANVYEQRGEYRQARKSWEAALEAYAAAAVTATEQANADFFMYYGSVYQEVYQDLPAAEKQYEIGLAFAPRHPGLLSAQVQIHLKKKEQALSRDDAAEALCQGRSVAGQLYTAAKQAVTRQLDKPGLPDCAESYGRARDLYNKAKKILTRQIDELPTAATFLELGGLHLTMADYSQAEKYFIKAKEVDGENPDVYTRLGTACLRMENYKQALAYFKTAVEMEPHNLSYRSMLAEAHLKNGSPEKAEIEYKLVADKAPGHIDALVGLGTVYTALAEELQRNGKPSDAENMFSQSAEYFSRALSTDAGSAGSRLLSADERAAIFHSRAYAHVMCYEVQTLAARDGKLLDQALRDFREVPRSNSNYYKAKRNIEKIQERTRTSRRNPIGVGAWIVIGAAAITFLTAQVAFYSRPHAVEVFGITEQSLNAIPASLVPSEILKKIEGLAKREPMTKDLFNNQIKHMLGDEAVTKFGDVIRKHASLGRAIDWREPMETGYYALLSFGSLVFMVAGLYLQQLSKLKVGGIELEKTAETTTKFSGSLGISK